MTNASPMWPSLFVWSWVLAHRMWFLTVKFPTLPSLSVLSIKLYLATYFVMSQRSFMFITILCLCPFACWLLVVLHFTTWFRFSQFPIFPWLIANIGSLVRFHKFPVHIASVNIISPLDFAAYVDPVIFGLVSYSCSLLLYKSIHCTHPMEGPFGLTDTYYPSQDIYVDTSGIISASLAKQTDPSSYLVL